MRATNAAAYNLLHEGSIAFSQMEANGIRVDVGRLDRTIAKCNEKVKAMADVLREDDVYKTWRKVYGANSDIDSPAQLRHILYKEMGYEATSQTETGLASTDEEALSKIGIPFTSTYITRKKYQKLGSTFLTGVRNEVEDELLHAVFNLHLVETYRSSSDTPNFQNLPIRDPRLGKPIRSCFIPRPGHVLVEIDYSAIEVRVAACYHKDPTMLKYIQDGYDMHKDMAAQCFKLAKDQVTKAARQEAKGRFVFAEFYGDWFKSVAKSLWSSIEESHLATAAGVPLYEHLAALGITERGACDPKAKHVQKGTYEDHIQQVEDDFWNRRFKKYGQWRRDWYDQYQETGGFAMHTGFYVKGMFSRNEVINAPVQGSAFHCLLWSLIRINKWFNKAKLRAMVVGQIHDSILLDVHKDEVDDVVAGARGIMVDDLRAAWPWIITPLEVEAEASETNWHEKKPFSIAA